MFPCLYFGVRCHRLQNSALFRTQLQWRDLAKTPWASGWRWGPRPWALPRPFRNLFTPLCSPMGSVSRYSWARTSNRPVDERNPRHLVSFLCTSKHTHFLTATEKRNLASELSCSYKHALNHRVYKGFYYPFNHPTLCNNCFWKAVKLAHT